MQANIKFRKFELPVCSPRTYIYNVKRLTAHCLYWCEASKERTRLKVDENRLPKRIPESQGNEVIEENI
jgi:hypothetical protein